MLDIGFLLEQTGLTGWLAAKPVFIRNYDRSCRCPDDESMPGRRSCNTSSSEASKRRALALPKTKPPPLDDGAPKAGVKPEPGDTNANVAEAAASSSAVYIYTL